MELEKELIQDSIERSRRREWEGPDQDKELLQKSFLVLPTSGKTETLFTG